MFKSKAFRDIDYFKNKAARGEQQAAALALTAHPAALFMKYMQRDGEAGAVGGRWIHLQLDEQQQVAPFFQKCLGDEWIDSEDLRRLVERDFPDAESDQRAAAAKRLMKIAGYDLTFSLPKTYSILMALGDDELTGALIQAQHDAVKATLRHAHEQGWIVSRQGRAGREHLAPAQCVVASFPHFTSRPTEAATIEDPQIHTHALLLNTALRQDGRIGCVDNVWLKRNARKIDAFYLATFADMMFRRLGIASSMVGDYPEADVIGTDLVDAFSHRRAEICAEVARRGFDTKRNPRAADIAALATRKAKSTDHNMSTLVAGWQERLRSLGMEPSVAASAIRSTMRTGPSTDQIARRHEHLQTALDRELKRLMAMNAVATIDEVRTCLQVAGQAYGSPTEIDRCIQQTLLTAHVVKVTSPSYDLVVSTAAIHGEHKLLRAAAAAIGKWFHFSDRKIELDPRLTEEQQIAVLHALNADGVTVVEGAAGVGKTFTTRSVVANARAAGLRVIVVAPSDTAKAIIAAETETGDDSAFSLQALARRIERGAANITARDVIIIDEAAMASTSDLSPVVVNAVAAGAKIILTGDTLQLKAVGAGAPMRALIDLLGSRRVNTIVRQHEPWMREASMALASGRIGDGIRAYDESGCVDIHATRDAAIDAVIDRAMTQAKSEQDTIGAWPLLMAYSNDDVNRLNALARQRFKSEGFLATEIDLAVPSMKQVLATRDPQRAAAKSATKSIAVSSGDKVMFVGKFTIDDKTVFNRDSGYIRVADPGHVIIELARHDLSGHPIRIDTTPEALAAALVTTPYGATMVHDYARTIHGSQGATVDHAILFASDTLASDLLYVGMTRHRKSAQLVIATDRLLPDTSPARIGITADGGLVTEDDLPSRQKIAAEPIDRVAVLAKLVMAAAKPADKSNISDLVNDRDAWIASSDPEAMFREQNAPPAVNAAEDIKTDPSAHSVTSKPIPVDKKVWTLPLRRSELMRLHDAVSANDRALESLSPSISEALRHTMAESWQDALRIINRLGAQAIQAIRNILAETPAILRDALSRRRSRPNSTRKTRRGFYQAQEALRPLLANARQSALADSDRRRARRIRSLVQAQSAQDAERATNKLAEAEATRTRRLFARQAEIEESDLRRAQRIKMSYAAAAKRKAEADKAAALKAQKALEEEAKKEALRRLREAEDRFIELTGRLNSLNNSLWTTSQAETTRKVDLRFQSWAAPVQKASSRRSESVSKGVNDEAAPSTYASALSDARVHFEVDETHKNRVAAHASAEDGPTEPSTSVAERSPELAPLERDAGRAFEHQPPPELDTHDDRDALAAPEEVNQRAKAQSPSDTQMEKIAGEHLYDAAPQAVGLASVVARVMSPGKTGDQLPGSQVGKRSAATYRATPITPNSLPAELKEGLDHRRVLKATQETARATGSESQNTAAPPSTVPVALTPLQIEAALQQGQLWYDRLRRLDDQTRTKIERWCSLDDAGRDEIGTKLGPGVQFDRRMADVELAFLTQGATIAAGRRGAGLATEYILQKFAPEALKWARRRISSRTMQVVEEDNRLAKDDKSNADKPSGFGI